MFDCAMAADVPSFLTADSDFEEDLQGSPESWEDAKDSANLPKACVLDENNNEQVVQPPKELEGNYRFLYCPEHEDQLWCLCPSAIYLQLDSRRPSISFGTANSPDSVSFESSVATEEAEELLECDDLNWSDEPASPKEEVLNREC